RAPVSWRFAPRRHPTLETQRPESLTASEPRRTSGHKGDGTISRDGRALRRYVAGTAPRGRAHDCDASVGHRARASARGGAALHRPAHPSTTRGARHHAGPTFLERTPD